MKEIEILVEVLESKEAARAKLKRFENHGVKHIVDTYYVHPGIPHISPLKRWENSLRVRQKGDKTLLTYKHDVFNNNTWGYCEEEEIETEKDITIILKELGFTPLVVVDNQREIFTTDKYEIVLDEVKDLGLFLEVELKSGDTEDVETVLEQIRIFIAALNIKVGPEFGIGKPELMLQRKKSLMKSI